MKKQAKFELFKSYDKRYWYFHLITSNSEIMLQSEVYTRKASAIKAIETLRFLVQSAPVSEIE